ncbi:hypothetical protein KFE25_007662 [Diacronema lutheri]|uniref:Glycosyl transferase CAP10 domain-containing protein n=2 Tax=Diacronema lutheri TaxID=2081491 RepID=A0A8J5Y0P1_DIALT|nr:hypothetical protein KFE25_007662 [Diacronema lutheri]
MAADVIDSEHEDASLLSRARTRATLGWHRPYAWACIVGCTTATVYLASLLASARSAPEAFPLRADLALAHLGCESGWVLEPLCRLTDDPGCAPRRMVRSEHLDLRPPHRQEIRLQVVRGALLAACASPPYCGEFRGTLRTLAALHRYAALPDLDVILSRRELACEERALTGRWNATRGELLRVPVFTTETRVGDARCENVLLPPRALADLPDNVRAAAVALGAQWDARERRAVWRGTVWGKGAGKAARERIVNASRARPDLLDARPAARGSPDFLTWAQLQRFRAVVSIDGFTLADRLAYLVVGGFAILRQETEWAEGWYRFMQPWVHYAPLRTDLADLVPVLQRVLRNDSLARALARNAALLGARHLSRRALTCHWLTLLHGYAQWVQMPVRAAPGAFRVRPDRGFWPAGGALAPLRTAPEHLHSRDPAAPRARLAGLFRRWHAEPCFPGLDTPTCVDVWR